MSSNPKLSVYMHSTLIDMLDEALSPSDGLDAIDCIHRELPKAHPHCASRRTRRNTLKLYRGRFDWIPIGFSYVQVGDALHILDLWNDLDWDSSERREVDAVISSSPDYELRTVHPSEEQWHYCRRASDCSADDMESVVTGTPPADK